MAGIWLLGYPGPGVGQQCAHWLGVRSIKSVFLSLTLIHASFTNPAITRQTLCVKKDTSSYGYLGWPRNLGILLFTLSLPTSDKIHSSLILSWPESSFGFYPNKIFGQLNRIIQLTEGSFFLFIINFLSNSHSRSPTATRGGRMISRTGFC